MEKQLTIIRPSNVWRFFDLKELFEYRELLYFLVWKNIKVKYKQTAIGMAWAIIQPFFTMIVFSLFFGKLASMPSDGIPYPIFTYCALVPWTYFSNSLVNATNSLVENQNVITKVYFPKFFLPLSAVMSNLIDFVIAFVILLGMMMFYGIIPHLFLLLMIPLFIVIAMLTALAVSLWLSAFNVKYRDVRYIVPFVVQIWLFMTPIAYSSSLIPEKWKLLYGFNPMVGVVDLFRWAILGKTNPNVYMILFSSFCMVILLIGGFLYFKKTEQTFADIV